MTPQQYQRLKALFAQAAALEPDDRAALLQQVRREQPEFGDPLAAMLAQDAAAAGFLEQPVLRVTGLIDQLAAAAAPAGQASAPRPLPQRIGPYHVLQLLGEGGMGCVYLAEQANPRRTVALKVLRPGVASQRALRRFQHEAQLLGRLRHPNIAQVYEAGAAGSNGDEQPYFAMELVHGLSITDYARQRDLGTRARLDLIRKVCDAVHHAHQKGVIHRDLKPGNILVDESTGEPQPKVLDFGVARVTDAEQSLTSAGTGIGQLIGTIPYMSPEQVGGDPLELDTRSDVYALGVVTYELLAGRLPYDLARKTLPEAARVIAHDDPTPLSAVSRMFRGDLDRIVSKALEKDKARRYQSAAELGTDIARYLRDEPILARPASAIYQLSKFARRNRGLVAAAAAVALALMLGVAGTLWQAVRATQGWAQASAAEALAQQRLDDAATARDEARLQAARADVIRRFLTGILASVDPETARGRDVTVLRDMLDRAADRADRELADQPLVRAEIEFTIGAAYHVIGAFEQAEDHLRAAVDLRRALGADDPDMPSSLGRLGSLLSDMGRFADAEPVLREALGLARRLRAEDDPRVIDLTLNLGELLWLSQHQLPDPARLAEAEQLFRAALAASRQHADGLNMQTAKSLMMLGTLLAGHRRFEEARQALNESLAILETLGGDADSRAVATVQFQQASLRESAGELDDAVALYRRALASYARVLEPGHPSLGTAQHALGRVLAQKGDRHGAEQALRRALDIRLAVRPIDERKAAETAGALAAMLLDQGEAAQAESLYRQALTLYEARFPGDHPWVARASGNVAKALRVQGRLDDAQAMHQRSLEIFRATLGPEHPDVATCLSQLASIAEDRGHWAQAIEQLQQALAIRGTALPAGHRATCQTQASLGRVLVKAGRAANAEPVLRQTADLLQRTPQQRDWQLAECRSWLGQALADQGRDDEAEPLMVQSVDDLTAALGPAHASTQKAITRLIAHLDKTGQSQRADSYRVLLVLKPPRQTP